MGEFMSNYALELLCTLITTATLGYAKHLHSQKKRFEQILQEDQNRRYRQMILDEIDPIVEELRRLNEKVSVAVTELKNESANAHTQLYHDLEQITKKNDKNIELIVNSYKFRLIQLCKTHLRDGWISQDDFDQICEMYKLYHGLGGNGQAHDYYERVMSLPVKEPNHEK